MAYPIDKHRGYYRAGVHDAFGAESGGRSFPHTGSDFTPNIWGDPIPVYAVEDGRVIAVGGNLHDTSGPGINVRIEQPSGVWLYGHLSRRDVSYGQRVKAGQQVGLLGNSGGTTGPHLHITRFTTRAAALANAVPTRRNGRSVAAWAAANNLADPMAIINRPAPTPDPLDPFEEIMSYYKNKQEFRADLADLIDRYARQAIRVQAPTVIRREVPQAHFISGVQNPPRENLAASLRRAHTIGRENRAKLNRIEAKLDALIKALETNN